jgi:Tol biopolymer transport system component
LFFGASLDVSIVHVGSLDSTDAIFITSASSSALYAPPGYLLLGREGALVAQPFDLERFQLVDEAFPIAQRIGASISMGCSFSVSSTGLLTYRPALTTRLVWCDRSGREIESLGPPGADLWPSISPDRETVAVQRAEHSITSMRDPSDIYLLDASGDDSSRFTFHPSIDFCPIWSPDGKRIVFMSNRGGSFDLYEKPSSGAGQPSVLQQSRQLMFPTDWSRDGKYIVLSSSGSAGDYDLVALSLVGGREMQPIVQTEFAEGDGQFSLDGRWLAYVSNETGRYEVYVQPFPTSGGKWQVSNSGGFLPRWRDDGKELFYIAADQTLVSVEVTGKTTFEAGPPKSLFRTQLGFSWGLGGGGLRYAVGAGGQRFLVTTPVESPLTVVTNWTAKLEH